MARITKPPRGRLALDATLLDAARRAEWTPAGAAIGALQGYALVVQEAGSRPARWRIVPAGKAKPSEVRLLTADAYAALQEGTLDGDTLAWRGKRWALEEAAEGERRIARLAPIE